MQCLARSFVGRPYFDERAQRQATSSLRRLTRSRKIASANASGEQASRTVDVTGNLSPERLPPGHLPLLKNHHRDYTCIPVHG